MEIVDKCLNCGKVEKRKVKSDKLGKFCECSCGATFDIVEKEK